jgi:glucose-6-phosphate 1-dehydrogenase
MASPSTSPAIFVIFGITGDLANRKILPALFHLYTKGLLPEKFHIIGFSRTLSSSEELRAHIRKHINLHLSEFAEDTVIEFIDRISCEHGAYNDPAAYVSLASHIEKINSSGTADVTFHISVPPNTYEDIVKGIGQAKLATKQVRILIEKPFGTDTNTAIALNELLLNYFTEEQIYRVDHYLAKPGLKQVWAARFIENVDDQLWNSEHIEKIHIQLLEKATVEGRARFYDSVGALRDVVQNHLLEMLAVLTMRRPEEWNAKNERQARAEALSQLIPIESTNLAGQVVRGQYEGYRNELGVAPGSNTETYVGLKVSLKSEDFKNVPVFIETGKALMGSNASIEVHFKPGMSPTEGDSISFNMAHASSPTATDYERLISDALVGDQTLFVSIEEVLAEWKFITPILQQWDSLPLTIYPKGATSI